mgnify:FL=1
MTSKKCTKKCKKMKSLPITEKCLVCFETFEETTDEIVVQLLCSHAFHYDCIIESYRMKTSKTGHGLSYRECPYCRNSGGYLPLLEGMKPEKRIHKEYQQIMKYKKHYGAWGQCKGKLANGKRCLNRAKSIVGEVCGKHIKQHDNGLLATYEWNQPPTPSTPTGPPILV